MLKWPIMLYVFITLSIEHVWLKLRCEWNRPAVYDAWPNYGKCLSCGKRHD